MRLYLFAPIRYDFLHQRPQKLAEQLLELGVEVTYVQPTGFRHVRTESRPVLFLLKSLWYHLLAVFSIIIPPLARARKPRPTQNGLSIISLPLVLPVNHFNSAALEALNARVFRLFLHRELASEDPRGSAAIFQNPYWGEVIAGNEFETICYDCLDDLSLYAGRASGDRFAMYEQKLLEKAAVVFVTAVKLEERLRVKTPKPLYRIPNGVDDEWFQELASSAEVPPPLASLPRPLVGYMGSIASWLDYELIVATARLMPQASFVFVGPAEPAQRLPQASNIVWLGRISYERVPAYIHAFDVCTIPFRLGEIAQTTNPVKVFEYFALGKPVVATHLHELERYEREGLLAIVRTPDQYKRAIEDALRETGTVRERRMAVARMHSWRRLAQTMLDAIRQMGRNE